MEKKILETLEYDKVLSLIADKCLTSVGREKTLKIVPTTDLKKIEEYYNLLSDLTVVEIDFLLTPLKGFSDARKAIKKAMIGATLSIKELLEVCSVLTSSRIYKTTASQVPNDKIPTLYEFIQPLYFNQIVEDDLISSIASETELNDNASRDLMLIRRTIKRLNATIKEKLEGYMRSQTMQKYLQDTIVTMRNDRYVIPVKQECRSSVKGLVHDQSVSKATVYIEPLEIVELNNQLKTVMIEEIAEIERILKEFTKTIGGFAESLMESFEILTELDVLNAKNKFGYENNGIVPKINDKGKINIIKGRHPLLDKNKVVPISIDFGEDYDFVTITGVNTGGKTVTLKTVGLFSLMCMSGILIPAQDDTVISVFNDIFCDIGDSQSIENNLSTFSSHIKNIVEITQKAGAKSLVLLDEVGGGTDPDEGSALAIGVLDYLIKKGAKGIVTTHYGGLKEYSLTREKVAVALVEFDYDRMQPTYKLKMNAVGSSNALKIAQTLGLNSLIISCAEEHLSDDKKAFEKSLSRVESIIQKTEENEERSKQILAETQLKQAEILEKEKELIARRESLERNAKIEAKRIINNAREESEELLAEIKEILNSGRIELKDYIEAGKIKNQLGDKVYNSEKEETVSETYTKRKPTSLNELKVGQTVFVNSLSNIAVITKINPKKNEIAVSVGNINTNIKFSEIMITDLKSNVKKNEKVSIKREYTNEITPTEINLLGQNVMEAIQNLELFIDRAVMGGVNEIRIIHGVGTGVLRKAVTEFLKTHANVEEFRFGKYGEGEKGVTFAKLK